MRGAVKLKPSEVRFWQEVFLARLSTYPKNADEWADYAVEQLRERIEQPEPVTGGPYRLG